MTQTITEITSLVPGLQPGMLLEDAYQLILTELKRLKQYELEKQTVKESK